jgi:hypothetical protein
MTPETMTASCELRTDSFETLLARSSQFAALLTILFVSGACAPAGRPIVEAAGPPVPDPRVTLRPGYLDAGQAAWNLELVANRPRPERFFDPQEPGSFSFANSDLAFSGNYLFQGGYNGIQIWDISNPTDPRLRSFIVCPGGQGDPSVYRNLLFMSVEETRGRLDCGPQGVTDTVSSERLRGVRIFDISDIDRPKQVAAVQTCRGSHTHTLVSHPGDQANIYVYVQGTSGPRPGAELAGCSALRPEHDPKTSLFRIEVIRVPLAAPQNARIVNMPRIFADASGNIAGLWKGGAHGEGTQTTAETNMCHDITAYAAIGLAAGACSGNGILLDIRDVVNPRRINEVTDPNFAYWHSATFNNDANKVIFTDEWGGGTVPRCRATDRPTWGANAIYTLQGGKLQPAGFYKLPAPQTTTENCVAHNGSLIPVPGRDIMVQAWYQGGISVFDFTDPTRPYEIAYFDRGPMSATQLVLAGHWSAYWYNGRIYGSEIARGLDVLELRPSAHLSQNEIDAAKLVRMDHFNVQNQQRIVWPPSFVVARAYLDQLRRNRGFSGRRVSSIASELDRAERLPGAEQQAVLTRLAGALENDASGARDGARVRAMAAVVRDLARR